MCGFVGILNKNGIEVRSDILRGMADTIHHRGPDEEGMFINDNCGFFHKRLSIIDLKTGQQPMSFGNLTIVFNGEIYNYLELKQELICKRHVFTTNSDTEVILHLYEEYGTDCINKLNGMFAFLIYDKKRNEILAARDHFGIKPLYFYEDKKQILFGSEIKALLAHPDVVAEPDNNNLHEYLTFQFILGEATLFKNIFKMSPGHFLKINLYDFRKEEVNYWKPNFSVDYDHTAEYFENKLQELLEDTIKMQLRSDVPVGTYLSGGFDSSLVTSLASKAASNQLSTFTGGFKESPEFDETNYAREVAKQCNAKAFEIYPTANDFIETLPKLIYHLDEPVAGPGVFPQYMVSKKASENVTVVLGGQGGDEIFGGYARYLVAYLEQALKGSMLGNMDEGEHIVSLKTIIPNLKFIRNYAPMLKNFWSKDVFEPMDKRYFNLIDRMSGNQSYYTKEFANSYNYDGVFNKFSQLFNDPNTLSYYNKMTHFDIFGSMPALLQVEDRVSMAASIESRVPLLDRRIIDLVATMPPAMKFKGGELKYFIKKAMGHHLPQKVLNRQDKMGFPVPLHMWAKNEAREFILDTFKNGSCVKRGIFNNDKIEEMITSEKPFSRQLWGMLCLEIWFNTFIDNN